MKVQELRSYHARLAGSTKAIVVTAIRRHPGPDEAYIVLCDPPEGDQKIIVRLSQLSEIDGEAYERDQAEL